MAILDMHNSSEYNTYVRNGDSEMEHKTFRFDVKADDEGKGIIEGYASTFSNVDLQNDVVEPGAFTKTLREHPHVVILSGHDELIGVQESAEEDAHGLKVRGRLVLDVPRARADYALVRAGALNGISMGWQTIKDSMEGRIRHLKEVRLREWSLTPFPANEEARITGVKSGERLAEVLRETLARPTTLWDYDTSEALMLDLLDRLSLNDDLSIIMETKPAGPGRGWDDPPGGEYYHYRVRDPDLFLRLRTIGITNGVKARIGPLKSDPDGGTKVQVVMFSKKKFTTMDAAKAWLKNHPDIAKSASIVSFMDLLALDAEPGDHSAAEPPRLIEPDALHSLKEVLHSLSA